MPKFRKKPVVIEAFQLTRETRASADTWPKWAGEAWQLERGEEGSLYPSQQGTGDGTLSIMTLEGEHLVSFNDYIIQGIKGEIYPCKPDIFEATYEPYDPSENEDAFRQYSVQKDREEAFGKLGYGQK